MSVETVTSSPEASPDATGIFPGVNPPGEVNPGGELTGPVTPLVESTGGVITLFSDPDPPVDITG